MATADGYVWVEDSLGDAACVTVVVGQDQSSVLRAFNADPTTTIATQDADGYA